MERHLISRIAHRHHPVAAPLFDESVERLLARALPGRAERLLDLGCGEGAWLLRALAARPSLRAVGVDLDAEGLTRAREGAERLGLARRIGLHHQDAREFEAKEPFDAVLCIGSTHAFGGLAQTLAAVRPLLAPDGVAVVGEGYWQREPDRVSLEIFGDGFSDLSGTVARVTADGWTPVYGHASSEAELDEYEFAWTGSLAEWALDHPEDPGSADALRVAAQHRDEWLDGYRGVFGFVTLVLRRSAP
ncbi:class I SAM-dependent methyltransferase [Kitasatospora sp. NPDC049258]|uniref:SAM-dependent methyltransferase n=1 Tax=Kitasatospora sp. NPDC049258 TaxID=3155394 RepID=UPI00341E47FC